MNKLSNRTKQDLYKALNRENYLKGIEHPENGLLDFLNEIWDLGSMKSEDPRYDNAYDDIVQHTVNNYDWDYDQLLLDRLKLYSGDQIFIKYLETIVSPKYRNSEDDILNFVSIININLEKEEFVLSVESYSNDNLPVYKFGVLREGEFNDILKNNIPFYVDEYRASNSYNINQARQKPYFILEATRWDDYDYKTEFILFYFTDQLGKVNIGEVKITDGKSYFTKDVINKKFTKLDSRFFSLGQSKEYYERLKDHCGKNFISVLYALRDVAFFTDIQDKIINNSVYKTSLIRYNENEKLLREIKPQLYGYNQSTLYNIEYRFKPKYSDETEKVSFYFKNEGETHDRIYGIIGKNGTGKTQLITSLPIDIAENNYNSFSKNIPHFSKVIAVSYSLFDNFDIPKKTSNFNYIHCGLIDKNKKRLSERGLSLRFHRSWKKIREQGSIIEWKNILSNFIEKDILDSFIVPDNTPMEDDGIDRSLIVNLKEYGKIKNQLSSGQGTILYIMTEIIANIRLDSLILFDEPETHLHPNAISQLMNVIYDLVEEFESYCIITTHSPLVIQELFAKNVYVIRRDGNTPSVKKIGKESFGQNLTELTEEIFGNKDINRRYEKIIDELVDNYNNYDKIIEILHSDGQTLSLNIRLYIKSRLNNEKD